MISKVIQRKNNRERRKYRIRKRVTGTSVTPRLSVFRSNKYIYGQLIDDTKGITLVDISNEVKKMHKDTKKSEAAQKCGEMLAQKAITMKIERAVFDRNGYIYTGRVASFAEGARKAGLKF